RKETARLLYVALTRAECHSIMAFGDPTGKNNILNAAADEELLTWDLPEIRDDSTLAVDEVGELRIANRRAGEDGNTLAQTGLPIRITAHPLSSDVPPDAQPPRQSFYAYTDIPVRQPAKGTGGFPARFTRSEEHTSELQSRFDIVCRLLLEKKK